MTFESLVYSVLIIVLSLIIDTLFGELPDRIHPVIYMDNVIQRLKDYLPKTRFSGLLIVITTNFIFIVVSLLILLICMFINNWLYILIAGIILSSTFSIDFLIRSVRKIQRELKQDIDKARKSMSYLVSRDTSQLTESRITSAAIETLTENITDSIVAPLFYTAVFGLLFGMIIGIIVAIIYRVSNTMDAILGYKTKELINIGYYPAKVDDYLNYIPARITGYYIVLAAFILRYDYRQSYDVMKEFAHKTPSPNSGYSMSATAGAINVTLTKEGVYSLGYGTDELDSDKITEAVNITRVTSILFIFTILVIYFIYMYLIF